MTVADAASRCIAVLGGLAREDQVTVLRTLRSLFGGSLSHEAIEQRRQAGRRRASTGQRAGGRYHQRVRWWFRW